MSRNGGYKRSDFDYGRRVNDEPYLKFTITNGEFTDDIITTASHIFSDYSRSRNNELRTRRDNDEPLDWGNVRDFISGWGEDDDKEGRLRAQSWFQTEYKLWCINYHIKHTIYAGEEQKVALKLRVAELEKQLKENTDSQLLFEVSRNRCLRKEIEEVRAERDAALEEVKRLTALLEKRA